MVQKVLDEEVIMQSYYMNRIAHVIQRLKVLALQDESNARIERLNAVVRESYNRLAGCLDHSFQEIFDSAIVEKNEPTLRGRETPQFFIDQRFDRLVGSFQYFVGQYLDLVAYSRFPWERLSQAP